MSFASIKYEKAPVDRGYTDRYLDIDLRTGSIAVREVPPEMRRMFVGGRGYCLKLVYDGTTETTRYDSPENVLALAGGPFCGESGFAGTGKFIVGAISPLTGTFCDSNVGGYFFPLVKNSGFDAISITGKADREVLIFIDSDAGEIRIEEPPETEFSLFRVEKLFERYRGESKPTSVALINTGTGAINSFFGCINSIYYDLKRQRCRAKQAGRGGLGTVMRDKRLWGIAVKCDMSKGISNRPVDRQRIRKAGKSLRGVIDEVDPGAMRLQKQGTTCLIDMMTPHHLLPVKNYQLGTDERARNVSGRIFENGVFQQKHPDGCFAGCTLACTKGCESHLLKSGPLAGTTIAVDGPEYETAAAITNLGIFDIGWMLEYAWYCDEYGLDTISTGVSMAFAFEAFQRGYLTDNDTDGLRLQWGSAETVMEIVHRIGAGAPGFAHQVSRGTRRLKKWVAERACKSNGHSHPEVLRTLSSFAMECKGLEFSMYVTRESLAQQGGYGFSLKGPQHDETWLIGIDQINKELPTFEQKAEALRWFPLFRTWFNIAGLCKLPWIDVRHPEARNTADPSKNLPTIEYYLEFVNATLGTEKTLDDLLSESERCYLLHKLINLRQGYGTREHDRIPMRAMAPVFPNEFSARREYYLHYLGEVVGVETGSRSDEELLAALQDYRAAQYEKLSDAVYRAKGYDGNAIPLDETLHRLGFTEEGYFEIVRQARGRLLINEQQTSQPAAALY